MLLTGGGGERSHYLHDPGLAAVMGLPAAVRPPDAVGLPGVVGLTGAVGVPGEPWHLSVVVSLMSVSRQSPV